MTQSSAVKFDFNSNAGGTSATFRFKALSESFERLVQTVPKDEIQKVLNSGRRLKGFLKQNKRVTLTVGKGTFMIVQGEQGGDVGDATYTFNRFYGCVAAYIYKNIRNYNDVVCPLSESVGLPIAQPKIYWSGCVGAYFNVEKFGTYPAVIELLKYRNADEDERDPTYMISTLRQQYGDATVYDYIMANKDGFKDDITEVSDSLEVGNAWKSKANNLVTEFLNIL